MNPFGVLFLLLLLVPMVEIYFLITVGGIIGAIPTVGLVVFTALLGAMLLRFQGWTTLQSARITMARGQVPALEMMSGVILLLAGILLLIPGFITDAIGFVLLVPVLRLGLVRWFLRHSDLRSGDDADSAPPRQRDPYTIEGEYRRDDD